MKKFFCFYCQQDVTPLGFWKFRYCPNCRHHITDDGSGFYKVCDVCGANLPANAHKCIRCGYNFNVEDAIENYAVGSFFNANAWFSWLVICFVLFISVIAAFGLLYVIFYLVGIAAIFMLAVLLFNAIRLWLHNI